MWQKKGPASWNAGMFRTQCFHRRFRLVRSCTSPAIERRWLLEMGNNRNRYETERRSRFARLFRGRMIHGPKKKRREHNSPRFAMAAAARRVPDGACYSPKGDLHGAYLSSPRGSPVQLARGLPTPPTENASRPRAKRATAFLLARPAAAAAPDRARGRLVTKRHAMS